MVGTNEEHIQNQHEDAVKLVNDCYPCCNNADCGEISLVYKREPTCNLGEQKVPFFSSRGHVDVTSIVQLIQEGYDEKLKTTLSVIKKRKATKGLPKPGDVTVKSLSNLWDLNNAYQNNVHIVRPSHDLWGIKKIILVFCDDFLRAVYETPWLQPLQKAIQPVLDKLNVPHHRIVRMLFASLPPNVTIPVHHDTGEWVKWTHRIHVPVIVSDPDRVLFRCGLVDTDNMKHMQRVSVVPGHVFELNNQAKHAVSNCSSDYRVHLILDYMDEKQSQVFAPTRVKLTPGERIYQTRRTISRECDYGKRPTPSYMILGCQKAGTTSLYEYLNQHPLVIRAKRRETHCLDWRWLHDDNNACEQQRHCLSFYYHEELQSHPSLLTGDSTPSYILHSDVVIPRLKRVFPSAWPMLKFFVMLRDPVKRCYSQYHMVTSEDGTDEQKMSRGTDWLDMSFEQVVEEDFQQMYQVGLIPYWNNSNYTIDEKMFEQFVGSSEELLAFSRYQHQYIPMNRGSHSPVVRGLYHLQLRCWLNELPRDNFMIIQLESLSCNTSTQRIISQVFNHLGLPPVDVEDVSAKNTRPYDKAAMKPETQTMLERFYAPHNRMLHTLLGDDEWTGVWPYFNKNLVVLD